MSQESRVGYKENETEKEEAAAGFVSEGSPLWAARPGLPRPEKASRVHLRGGASVGR